MNQTTTPSDQKSLSSSSDGSQSHDNAPEQQMLLLDYEHLILECVGQLVKVDGQLRNIASSLSCLSPELGNMVLDLASRLDISSLSSELATIPTYCGRVLELCLSLLLVTLRIGTPATSPFDVRLAWLQKLPMHILSDTTLQRLLSRWKIPNSHLSSMGVLHATRTDGSSSLTTEQVTTSASITTITPVVHLLMAILGEFRQLQSLLQQQITEYCGIPPLGAKHYSKLCCFSIDGKCLRGEDQCPYAHSYEQIREHHLAEQQTNPSSDSFEQLSRLHSVYKVPKNSEPPSMLAMLATNDEPPLFPPSNTDQHWPSLYQQSNTTTTTTTAGRLSTPSVSANSFDDHSRQPTRHSSPASTQHAARQALEFRAQQPEGPKRKTQICRHWKRSYCRLGDRCNFAHGSNDLAPFVPRTLTNEANNTTDGDVSKPNAPLPPTRRYFPLTQTQNHTAATTHPVQNTAPTRSSSTRSSFSFGSAKTTLPYLSKKKLTSMFSNSKKMSLKPNNV